MLIVRQKSISWNSMDQSNFKMSCSYFQRKNYWRLEKDFTLLEADIVWNLHCSCIVLLLKMQKSPSFVVRKFYQKMNWVLSSLLVDWLVQVQLLHDSVKISTKSCRFESSQLFAIETPLGRLFVLQNLKIEKSMNYQREEHLDY